MNITKDATWGWILIALGIALLIFHPGDKINRWLSGKSETFVTVGIVVTMAVYGIIAWRGSPTLKAVALAWAVTP